MSGPPPRAVFRFGIYPGGPIGAVGDVLPPVPEDPARRLEALRMLGPPTVPLVVRLYCEFAGNADADSDVPWLDAQIDSYADAGFEIELVLTYRPRGRTPGTDVPEFTRFVRKIVVRYADLAAVIALQVTNEANVSGSPAASDGDYPGAIDALLTGVVAARDEATRDKREGLALGFSWASDADPRRSAAFFRELRRGGPPFLAALDWVGIDAYPGTWGPPLSHLATESATGAWLIDLLRAVRMHCLPLAAIPQRVSLRLSEIGYPTDDAERTPERQAQALRATVVAAHAARAELKLTDYRWFALRDSNSLDPSFEGNYGLFHHDYSPKPAVATWRSLVRQLNTDPDG